MIEKNVEQLLSHHLFIELQKSVLSASFIMFVNLYSVHFNFSFSYILKV